MCLYQVVEHMVKKEHRILEGTYWVHISLSPNVSALQIMTNKSNEFVMFNTMMESLVS